jgi:hypothetical protein
MSHIHSFSLLTAIDACSEEYFTQKTISLEDRQALAMFFTSRQVLSGSNIGFFTTDTTGLRQQTQLFTGETLRTQLAARHIPLIEIPRLLILLAISDEASLRCIELADQRMRTMCYSRFCASGECRALTIAYMRYLNTNRAAHMAGQLNLFLEQLQSYRDGKGGWRGFPYFYTVLMLAELDSTLCKAEFDYTRPMLEKLATQHKPDKHLSVRRQAIIKTILSRS